MMPDACEFSFAGTRMVQLLQRDELQVTAAEYFQDASGEAGTDAVCR